MPEEPTHVVQICVNCEKNLLTNRYDVSVNVDGEAIGSVKHGSEATFEVKLTEGQHELELEDKGNTNSNVTTTFNVQSDSDKFFYRVKCSMDRIEIESIE